MLHLYYWTSVLQTLEDHARCVQQHSVCLIRTSWSVFHHMDNRVYWGYIVFLKKIIHICSQEAKVYCPVGSPHKPKCSSYAGYTSGMLRCLKECFAFQGAVYSAALSASHGSREKGRISGLRQTCWIRTCILNKIPRWFACPLQLEKPCTASFSIRMKILWQSVTICSM